MDRETRMKRLKFRAWHRGTKEADFMIGGYFDTLAAGWSDTELAWFEELIDEQDADIIGWAIGTIAVPERWRGPMMQRLQQLDFIEVPR